MIYFPAKLTQILISYFIKKKIRVVHAEKVLTDSVCSLHTIYKYCSLAPLRCVVHALNTPFSLTLPLPLSLSLIHSHIHTCTLYIFVCVCLSVFV